MKLNLFRVRCGKKETRVNFKKNNQFKNNNQFFSDLSSAGLVSSVHSSQATQALLAAVVAATA